MTRKSLAMNPSTCARLAGLAIITPIVFASTAFGQSSFKSGMGAGVLDFGVSNASGFMILADSGDYNNDGLKDYLFGYDIGADEIMVALGQVGGQFEIVGPFTFGASYDALSAGDIDGDGSVEFVARSNFQVRTLWSDSGIVETEEQGGIEYIDGFLSDSTFRAQVNSGDLDGDGGTDFVFNTTRQRVLVRWSSRDQSDPYETVFVPALGDQNAIFPIEDYDGDGDLDILIYDEDSTKFILIEGNGTNAMGAVRVIDQAYPRVAVGDRPLFGQFDDDPAMDMVIHDLSVSTAGIVLGFANPGETLIDISVGEPIIPIGAEGDLDGSGAPDIVVMRTSVLHPAADAGMQGALLVDPLAGGSELVPMVIGVPFDEESVFSFSIQTPRVDSIDLDNDGDLDLLWFGYLFAGNQARVTLNQTGVQGVPQFGASYMQGRSGPLHVLAADLDGDSVDEAIITGGTRAWVYDLSDGTSSPINGTAGAFMSVMADLENDGSPELVIVGNTVGIKVFPVEPDGTIGVGGSFNDLDLTDPQAVVVADFDLDGRDDLAVSSLSTGSVQILRGIEGPGLELWGQIDGVEDFSTVKPAVMDFNTDGSMDIVIGDRSNDAIRFYQNNNDGTFSLTDTLASNSPYWLTASDIDLDGNIDIAVVNNEFLLNIYFLDAAGQVDQAVELVGVLQMVEVVAEDFVGDSLPDLAVATSGGSFINSGPSPMVWEQTSPRVFEIVAALPTGEAPGIAASDVNNDGAMDILTVSDFDRSLMIHWGSPASCPADLTGNGTLNFFDISAFLTLFNDNDPIADFNGDGTWNFFDISAFLEAFAAGCP